MLRTFTLAAATAALLLPGAPLPGAGSGSAEASAGRWTAREAAAFWTPARMASAVPVPDPPAPGTAASGTTAPGATAPGTATSGAATSGAAAPGTTAPGTATPGAAASGATLPGATAPGTTAPGTVTSGTTTPGAAAPGTATAGTATSGTTASGTTASGSAAPGTTPPGAATTAAAPAAPSAPEAAAASAAAAAAALPAPAPAASTPPAPVPPAPTPAPSPLPARVLPTGPAGVGQDFDGIPVVGRMFVMKGAGAYFCTASVVSSPGRNMVLSAAHCLLGSDTRQIAFVPQYTRANPRPYGMFPVLRDAAGRSKIWIASRYRTEGAAKAATLDVAFAQVGPDTDGEDVEDVVGGNRLVTGATFNHPKVVLIGHPAPAPRPRVCVNKTTKFTSTDPGSPGSFLRIDCTGYPGGTSGGPFITRFDEDTATGDVVGVIGGWETGGPTADTSYSAYFGAEVRKLYQSAVAGVRAE
ncbi:hypothetical protein AB0469_37425 [Streptomyces sp. NPDC093801]|uniref:hypothetical protein n=1 Tax=Streptomyces sp. NPDC093801 TaxID=3155203 RepID=UPI00344D30F2